VESLLIAEISVAQGCGIIIQSRKCLENGEKHKIAFCVLVLGQVGTICAEFLEFSEYRVYTYGLFYKFKLKH